MIDCDACGKRHRDKTKIIECRVKTQKREEREAKKARDIARREANLEASSVADFIQNLLFDGVGWQSIPKQVRDNYPPDPSGRDWDRISCIAAQHPAKWPIGVEPLPELDVAEKLALARVMKQLDAVISVNADIFVDEFIRQFKEFAAAEWVERTPWKTTSGKGSHWGGWPSDLSNWYFEQLAPGGANDGEEDE